MKKLLIPLLILSLLSVGAGAHAASAFNPDEETDTIAYSDLGGKFGAMTTLSLPKDVSLGSILKNQANEFWLMLGSGMQDEAAKYGATIDIQATRTETDTAGQLSIAETMIQNNYSALILSPLTNDCLDGAVAVAKAAGKPVVNANCEYIADCDVFVGGLQIEIGYKAADYIADKIGSKGKVAIIEGVAGTFTSIQRVNGFREKMREAYPSIDIVASVPADYETEKGLNVATDILTANPDIAAIYCCNDNMALGAVEALRARGLLGKVIVLGVDGTGDAYNSIAAGELTATVDQFPAVNGSAAVEAALRLLAGQKLPKVVSTPIEVIDVDNAAKYGK
ncbi:MAG: substrate-binding domain-containing protein [Planctomycetota bacterium]|jgi:ribose transport system substrate-binding protein|nr:substrate-binding domain-containing protein [Planctomycetota bacterium]